VLVYRTPPLEADLTLAGPFRAALAVATTGTDADVGVTLSEVYTGDAPGTSDEGVPMGGCGERSQSPTECGAARVILCPARRTRAGSARGSRRGAFWH
jgi:predicted acyl esterase